MERRSTDQAVQGRSEVAEWGSVELVQNRGNGRPLRRTGTRSTDDVESPLCRVREKAEVRQHSAIHPGIVVHVPEFFPAMKCGDFVMHVNGVPEHWYG